MEIEPTALLLLDTFGLDIFALRWPLKDSLTSVRLGYGRRM